MKLLLLVRKLLCIFLLLFRQLDQTLFSSFCSTLLLCNLPPQSGLFCCHLLNLGSRQRLGSIKSVEELVHGLVKAPLLLWILLIEAGIEEDIVDLFSMFEPF